MEWSRQKDVQFISGLRVMGEDRVGIVSDITTVISKNLKTNIRSITVDSDGVPDDGDDSGSGGSSPPEITGDPPTKAVVGSLYTYRPDSMDPDGDTLSFSIVNKPDWAAFNAETGRIRG